MSLLLPSSMPSWNGGAPWRIVFHTVEGTSLAFRYPPHIGINARDRLVNQPKLFDRSAAALEHPAGTPPTNTAGAIQVELAGFTSTELADRYGWPHLADWPDDWVDFVAEQLAPVHRYFAIPAVAAPQSWTRAGDRMARDVWLERRGGWGVCDHAQVPDQPSGHWDGTGFNVARYCATVARILAGGKPTQTPAAPPEDDMPEPVRIIYIAGSKTKYLHELAAGTKRRIPDTEILASIYAEAHFTKTEVLERPCEKAYLDWLREV